MTYQELAAQVRRLPIEQRLDLLDVLARSLKEELQPPVPTSSTLHRIRGIGKPEGAAPTDQELAEEYTLHLARKYS